MAETVEEFLARGGQIKTLAITDRAIPAVQPIREISERTYRQTSEKRKSPTAKELEGKRFGQLTVLSLVGSRSGPNRWWLVRCDCGEIEETITAKLTSGTKHRCQKCGYLARYGKCKPETLTE